MASIGNMPSIKRRLIRLNPSAFLLVAQLLVLVLHALFDDLKSQRGLISAFSVVILVLVVWVVSRNAKVSWFAWTLAGGSFFLSLLSAFIENANLLAGSSLVAALLYFYAAGGLIVYMMSDDKVTRDELFGLGATFTLLAWGFAYLYLVCQTWLPGSFFSSIVVDRPLTFLEFLSLSFTNLTATGLGDIMPAGATARILVMLEQFVGIGYVAMVVSRLISLTTQRKKRP